MKMVLVKYNANPAKADPLRISICNSFLRRVRSGEFIESEREFNKQPQPIFGIFAAYIWSNQC
jgi:hypothetical protein